MNTIATREQELEDALKDIVFGANMMLEGHVSGAFRRYAEEVKRVAEAALVTPAQAA